MATIIIGLGRVFDLPVMARLTLEKLRAFRFNNIINIPNLLYYYSWRTSLLRRYEITTWQNAHYHIYKLLKFFTLLKECPVVIKISVYKMISPFLTLSGFFFWKYWCAPKLEIQTISFL